MSDTSPSEGIAPPPASPIRRRRWRRRLYRFFNTNLGLFVLSTVFLGTLSFCWSTAREWRREQQAKQIQIYRLRMEINARVERCLHLVQGDWNKPTGVPINSRMRQCGIAGPPPVVVVFPEFERRPLTSLYWELRMLEGDPKDLMATSQIVAEQVEESVWFESQPDGTELPPGDAYGLALAHLTTMRLENRRLMDAEASRIRAGLRQMTPAEAKAVEQEEERQLRAIPGYREAIQQAEAERKQKNEILKARRDGGTPSAVTSTNRPVTTSTSN